MLSSLFQSSSLPVLEQVVNFTEARHGVLAGNIANIDTPGYKTRDLSPELFQQRLQEAIATKNQPVSPTSLGDVAGAWAHSRGLERVLGGVTRTMIETSTLPVLLSH